MPSTTETSPYVGADSVGATAGDLGVSAGQWYQSPMDTAGGSREAVGGANVTPPTGGVFPTPNVGRIVRHAHGGAATGAGGRTLFHNNPQGGENKACVVEALAAIMEKETAELE
jgi:hypothetical protein